MMKRKIKLSSQLLLWSLTMCLGLSFFAGLTGCSSTKSDGYFTYINLRDGKIGLTGLTKSGQEQEVIVIPQYIKGKEVISFDNAATSLMGRPQNKWKSTKLKKVFIPFEIDSTHNPFEECKNLTRTILIPAYYSGAFAGYFKGGAGIDENENNISRVYYPYDGNDAWTSTSFKQANLSYMWNYEGSESVNKGYYWVDDEDYGTKIEFIPPMPARDGYTFKGWYKEPEGNHEWDFENDRSPEEILSDFTNEYGITAQYPALQRTILYAKWQIK